MATYAIGDIQGCCDALLHLLDRIAFDPARDRLLLAGDLVARGPDSLGVLRELTALGAAVDSVLGNHDLHFLAISQGLARAKPADRLERLLTAPELPRYIDWLRQRPLFLALPEFDAVMTHAGIPPHWTLADTRARAAEVEAALRGPDWRAYLAGMYGNQPQQWSDTLSGTDRLRVITNHLTRMRVCHPDGTLDFDHKEGADNVPAGLLPWFKLPNPGLGDTRVLFGHWAALLGNTGHPQFIGLDTGCVWGHRLTAWRLDDDAVFDTDCGC